MKMRVLDCGGPGQMSDRFISVGFINGEGESNINGAAFTLPYVRTYREAAQLAHEMREAIEVLEDFIQDGQPVRPQIDVIL